MRQLKEHASPQRVVSESRIRTVYAFSRRACLAVVLLYPALHFGAAWLGLFLTSGTQTATLWTSNALLLAAMIILGRRWWPGILLGLAVGDALVIGLLGAHLGVKLSLVYAASNWVEAFIAALLWQRLVHGQVDIFRLRDSIVLVFVVALVAPAVSGMSAGLGAMTLGRADEFIAFWQLWWAANALGIMVISTTVLAWFGTRPDGWQDLASRRFELLVLVGAVGSLSYGVFHSEPGNTSTILGLPHVLFPFLIWGALRFGTTVSTTLVLLIALIAIIGTDGGKGPFAISSYTVYQQILSLQMFLAAAAISVLLLSAAFADRLKALRVLRVSEEKFARAFQATPDAICIAQTSDGHVIDINQSFADMIGRTRAEAIGCTLSELGLSPFEKIRVAAASPGTTPPKNTTVDCRIAHRSGTETACQLAFETVEINARQCQVFVLHDMTHIRYEENKRRELEAELLQARKMEAVGQLTGGIAHDFNNYLFAIIGNTELAELRARELGDVELKNALRQIREGSNRARELVAQLLTFSRNKPGNPMLLDLSGVMGDVLGMVRQMLPSGMTINTSNSTDGLLLSADRVQLQQLVLNLCVNARDANDGNGSIDIAVDLAHEVNGVCSSCGKTFSGDFARLSVRDSGPGIGPETLEKIFEPFYTSKAPGVGTGLGLSVVHGVVHGHGGHLVVDGTPGKTTISSFFPLPEIDQTVRPQQEGKIETDIPAITLEGHVLLIDDDTPVLDMMARRLEQHGLKVVALDSSEDALTRFEEDPDKFDLVITDQTMPNMTGAMLAGKILAIRPELPVIVCSGYINETDKQRAEDLGVLSYHQKPLDFKKLIAQIASIQSAGPDPGT